MTRAELNIGFDRLEESYLKQPQLLADGWKYRGFRITPTTYHKYTVDKLKGEFLVYVDAQSAIDEFWARFDSDETEENEI